ncbi:hypothetical protein A5886_001427 [Enterococcus sp. 8G7_MSG3316]|uniref:PTS EIIA type-4 domain-containing protein n=1 Tax=Candidatus Enterococcus testudinis TaxID=1834191 RepID=A0A242A628_9ENTE|nr:hypothetical protein [Enterococcus sp. 8G7_MSG3316]OTN76350.1 hypothetical protein A5886_001427 [Enterococcus sp. 8G7_MSG3316]
MDNRIGVLLASHGRFAQEALNSLKMILGDIENMGAVALEPGTDLNGFVEIMEDGIRALNTEEGLVIFCDIFGGTPSNAAAMILMKNKEAKYMAYSGLNLGILLEIAHCRNQSISKVEEKVDEVLPLTLKKIELAKSGVKSSELEEEL